MKAIDRLILALTRRRRSRRRDRESELVLGLPGLETPVGYDDAPDAAAETGKRTHGALWRRRTMVGKAVVTAVVVLALPAAAFAGGVEYAEYRADEQAMETDVYYQTQLREVARDSEARDLCLATAEARGGGGYWAGVWARLEEAPELTACYAEQAAEAAEIRADGRGR